MYFLKFFIKLKSQRYQNSLRHDKLGLLGEYKPS